MPSDAVGLELISKIVGYKITKGDFKVSSPNLPIKIAVLAEANHANQANLDTDGLEITTAKKAGELYGYGSPVYHIMRILRPVSGGGIGGIPVVVYPQAAAVGATAKVYEITPTGTATGNGTHYLKIAGRTSVDGQVYAINISAGDTADDLVEKMSDAVNAVLGAPFIGTFTTGVGAKTTTTSKWRGLTANGLTLSVDTGNDSLGITYAVASTQNGAGTPSIAAALAQFQENWIPIVINSYGTESNTMAALEDYNGIPDPDAPTGRYTGIIMKPFIALTGSVEDSADDLIAITSPRKEEVTIAICPAPNSLGLALEAAANYCAVFAPQTQNTPHLDVQGAFLPDMPTPDTIGDMNDYAERDRLVKNGCSTVEKISGQYKICDFVTTYHPDGEIPAQFNYCRNLMIDYNVRYGYYLLELINVVDHAIAANNVTVSASKVIKPKMWVQILNAYAEDLTLRALIADPAFMQTSLEVTIGTSNPNRLETFFRYKRTGFARISATTAEAGFNFGN
jgi:phage tail sheath gpL-like